MSAYLSRFVVLSFVAAGPEIVGYVVVLAALVLVSVAVSTATSRTKTPA